MYGHSFVVAKQVLSSGDIEEIKSVSIRYKWEIRETKYLLKGYSVSSDFDFLSYLKYKMGVDMEEVVYYSN